MRTFKFADDRSYKFWNIKLDDTSFTVHYGRIGTRGQTQTKEFASREKAQKAYDKLIAEKLGKGYVETTAEPAGRTSTADVLERALIADPDDLAAHAAYADLLTQEGDPRGEFIQVQLRLEDPSCSAQERKQLQEREAELLQEHGRQWLGGLAEHLLGPEATEFPARRVLKDHRFQFARGWLDRLFISELDVRFARALSQAPEIRLLRRLEIAEETHEDTWPTRGTPAKQALATSEFLGNVRIFQLGELDDARCYMSCYMTGAGAVELIVKMPRLEELYLYAHHANLEPLFRLKNLKHLRVLLLYHGHHIPLEVLADNPVFGKLTHLLLQPNALEPGDEPYINLASVRALLNTKHLKKITHLRLRLSDLGDEGCEEIVRSGILRQLKELDLMHGRITDAGARTLAACSELKNLELLEISYNRLTRDGVNALQATGIGLRWTNQYGPDTDEMEYLVQGDLE